MTNWTSDELHKIGSAEELDTPPTTPSTTAAIRRSSRGSLRPTRARRR
jgi:hypothetical protein